jgi:ABC-type transporter MlaC component
MLLAVVCLLSNGPMAHAQTDDPVTLVETITTQVFADVTDNLEQYNADHEALKTMVRNDLMPLLDVDYAARLILGRAGRGIEQAKID